MKLLKSLVIASTLSCVALTSIAADKLVFGNIASSKSDTWNSYSVKAFEFAAEQKGVEVISIDPNGSPELALQGIEDLITRGVDGISLYITSTEQAPMFIEKANAAGIPISIENAKLGDDVNGYVSNVATEYALIGYEIGKYLAKHHSGKKVYFLEGQRGYGVSEEYNIGLQRAFDEDGNIELVGYHDVAWSVEGGLLGAQTLIQSGKKFDVLFANIDDQALGAIRAFEEAGVTGIPVVSAGGGPVGLDLIREGKLEMSMGVPVSLQGLLLFKTLWQEVNGTTPEAFYPVPGVPITKDNVETAISWDASIAAIDYIGGLD